MYIFTQMNLNFIITEIQIHSSEKRHELTSAACRDEKFQTLENPRSATLIGTLLKMSIIFLHHSTVEQRAKRARERENDSHA